MKQLATVIANSLWYLACLPESVAFHRATRAVAAAQRRLLLDLLQRNAASDYGRQHNFAAIRTVAEYQARVPLVSYDQLQPWIERIGAGQPQVLTAAPVFLLEPTSGATAATKLIPYTAALKREFQRGIAPWIVDLYTRHPSLLGGQAYWSVTPVVQRDERTSGGVPIGFAEDGEYLGGWQRALANAVFAVPPLVRLIGEMEAFRYVTLLFLLRSRALALISVWNPTFLSLLVGRLNDWWPQLADDMARGTISAPTAIEPHLLASLRALHKPAAQRATEIEIICRATATASERHARLWPHLRVISCWADAHAAVYARELAGLFPQAQVQGKGLLATEGFVSLPLDGRAGAALAVRSHFFEFLPRDEPSRPRLAHELEAGAHYSVVLTTGGGLYRYQLHDLVEVVGHYAACPLLRFVGKEDHIADWFGEKLHALHVERALAAALQQAGIAPAFVMLACETAQRPPAYTLFIETAAADESLLALGAEIEAALQQNFHYRYCGTLNQLAPLQVFRITGGGREAYLADCQAHGQRAGDIKPTALHRRDGWARVFQGQLVTMSEKHFPFEI